jgi:hypothetical protein
MAGASLRERHLTFEEVATVRSSGCYYGRVKRCRAPLMLFLFAVTGLGQIRLSVISTPDPTGAYPQSRLYTVLMRNAGPWRVELAAIQMPGGYVGSGTFFNCSVEQWSPKRKQWVVVWHTDPLPEPKAAVQIGPGEEREVCREMLPLPSRPYGDTGACLRIRVARNWSPGNSTWVSRSFVVGDQSGASRCP